MSKIVVNSITHSGNSGTDNLALDNSGNLKLSASIQDSSGNNGSTPAQIANGRAKAWICYDGSGTYSILSSLNVSSLEDIATGRAKIHWVTDTFSDANYVKVFGSSREGFNNSTHGVMYADSWDETELAIRRCESEDSGDTSDPNDASVACFA